jgi:hypothetical protein
MVPELLPVTRITFTMVAIGSGAAVVLALARRYALALGTLATTFLLFGAFAAQGMDATGPLVSARQGIAGIPPALLARSEIVYEAGEEYQLCGGLNFYLHRRLLLLEPPGFIPPTYLEAPMDELFIKPARFRSEWRRARRRFLLFIDPGWDTNRTLDFYRPDQVVSRGADSLILTNRSVR